MDKPEWVPEINGKTASTEDDSKCPPNRYILFPRKGGWSTFPYPDIAALLSAEGEVLYVSSQERSEEMPPAISVITLPEAEILLQQNHTAAVIAHPYWLTAVQSM
ncbi:TPA: hypothetical protein ACG3G9_003810, partial [Clostridioides difficile]